LEIKDYFKYWLKWSVIFFPIIFIVGCMTTYFIKNDLNIIHTVILSACISPFLALVFGLEMWGYKIVDKFEEERKIKISKK